MGPQPWGPVTRVRRKKAEIQDAGSTLTNVRMMRLHEAPFFYGFLVNNAFLACTHGFFRTLASTDQPVRVHCKRRTKSARIVFETRSKCQDFVARFKDDGLPHSVNSPFCNTTSTVIFRQSRSPELREIGRRFFPLWKICCYKVARFFP